MRSTVVLLFLLVLPLAPLRAAYVRVPEQAHIVIANWSDRPITEIYLSPASAADWGLDRLEGGSVPVGSDARLAYGGGCTADLRVVFDNKSAEERHELDVCQHPFIGVRPGWTTTDDTAGLSPPALIAVKNESGRPIVRFYLYPSGSPQEGEDTFGHDVLPDGQETDVLRPRAPTCDFSYHAVFEGDGGEERRSGIDLCRYRGVILLPRTSAR